MLETQPRGFPSLQIPMDLVPLQIIETGQSKIITKVISQNPVGTNSQKKTVLIQISIKQKKQDELCSMVLIHNTIGSDASYTKPFPTDYVTISPGQTIDLWLNADQIPNNYYIVAKAYSAGAGVPYDNTTTMAILLYQGNSNSSPTSLPNIPSRNDTNASVHFTSKLKSLADKNHLIDVPHKITTHLFFTLSVNLLPCPNNSCARPLGRRFAASVNNISFVNPTIDILQAYYYHVNGVFGTRFPNYPSLLFNFTPQNLPLYLLSPKRAPEVKILEYNSMVEIVLQGTNVAAGDDHLMHLHGYSFSVVGWGFGNFDKDKDPLITPLVNGLTTIRFKADNLGTPLGTTQLEATLCKLRNCSELLSVSLVYKLWHNDLKDVILSYRRNEMGCYDSLIFWTMASPQLEAPTIRFQSYKHRSYLSTGLYRDIPDQDNQVFAAPMSSSGIHYRGPGPTLKD
ncbi:hypothetical protein DVH24_022296 [Malus domestica]|uniref:Plastocyanin-like domain-containing protein n=1 Tax=Malus domestica TaxID=3750 RepID=A0A498KQW3_MALDO|nr:hypothetical protein DVH24_022296 [Malus domestica]